MKAIINFLLQGFGFSDTVDFKMSSFGHLLDIKIISILAVISSIITWISSQVGVSVSFLGAYAVLIIFEWITGIIASAKKGEVHSSRKLGRMLFKITVYAVPLYIFNTFQREVDFPEIAGYELDLFVWLFWTVIIVVIWQLFVSVLENLEKMNIRFAGVLLKILNNNFYKKFNLKEEDFKKDEDNE